MNNIFTIVFSTILAGLIVLLTYLTFQLQAIKKGYAELEYNHLLIKNQIKCAEKALNILAEVSKEGCVISMKDLKELENLNCGRNKI